jgi:hypothetical protein
VSDNQDEAVLLANTRFAQEMTESEAVIHGPRVLSDFSTIHGHKNSQEHHVAEKAGIQCFLLPAELAQEEPVKHVSTFRLSLGWLLAQPGER